MFSSQSLVVLGLFGVKTYAQSLWFQPGAQVTRVNIPFHVFVSTMTVPPFPVEASGGTSYHALWPGLQPTSDDFVYQNVVDDWYPSQTNTRWDVSTWYGSYDTAGDYREYQTFPVTVGDAITTDFQYHMPSGTWTETQIIEPGPSGTASGEAPSATNLNVAFKNFPNGAATLTQFLFVIELQGKATWNFGPLTFTGIIMTANTTSTSWCTNPLHSGSFTYKNTAPVATVVNGQCQCYIASLTFVGPTSNAVANAAAAAIDSTGKFNVTHGPLKFK